MKIFRKFFASLFLVILFFGSFAQISSVTVNAAVDSKTGNDPNSTFSDANIKNNTTCVVSKKAVKIWDIGKVSEFLPIIEKQCAFITDAEGNETIKPLTFAFIPDLIIRLIGFLFSLAFWLVPLWIVLYGLFIILLPFDGGINKAPTTSVATIAKKATEKAFELVAGLVIISISYTIIFTVLDLIGLGRAAENTDLSQFFNF